MKKTFRYLLLAFSILLFAGLSKAEECGLCNQVFASCLSKGGGNCDSDLRSCKSACISGQSIKTNDAISTVGAFFGNALVVGFGLFVGVVVVLLLFLAIGPRVRKMKERSLQSKINADPNLKAQYDRHQKLESLRWKAYRMTIEEMANETGLSERIIKTWLDRQGIVNSG